MIKLSTTEQITYGLLGALAIGGGVYFISKRRKSSNTGDERDDFALPITQASPTSLLPSPSPLDDKAMFKAEPGPRGIRNHNPGNIRISSAKWKGKVPKDQNSDGAFEQFWEYEYGVRALIMQIRTYINSYGLTSVEAIINRYAPSSENNTKAYVDFVYNETGFSSWLPLMATKDNLKKLEQAIAKHENGTIAVTNEQFHKAWELL